MELVEKNEELLRRIDDIIDKIWKNQREFNKELTSCIKDINEMMRSFIGRIEEFKNYGVDIPEDIILSQIKNLMNGYENKDSILLADTMEYEIKNTILFYNDILIELDKEQKQIIP